MELNRNSVESLKRQLTENEENPIIPLKKPSEASSQNHQNAFKSLISATTQENGESASETLSKISGFLGQVFPLSKNEKGYKCVPCGLGFEDSILWMTHVSFHDSSDVLKCSGCERKFENRIAFVIHLQYFAHGPAITEK